jgi:hypothetical protein
MELSEMLVDAANPAAQEVREGPEAITEEQQGDSSLMVVQELTGHMPGVMQAWFQSQNTVGHEYKVKAYMQEVMGMDHGAVWKENVCPDLRVVQVQDLAEHFIENENALMLGGLKVGFTPEQAVHIACLQFKEKQAGSDETQRLAAKKSLDEFKDLSTKQLLAAIEAGEHEGRFVKVGEHGLMARNITGEELKARVLSGEEKNPIADYVCVGKTRAVDCWSEKTSKLLYPAGSKFQAVLTSGSMIVDMHDKEGPVRNVNGVGQRIEPVLMQIFQIKTVGALAELTDENLERFQERIRTEKLAGGRINLKTLRKKANDLLNAGMPDATEENEEADLDHQEHLELGTITEDQPIIVTLHDTQLESDTENTENDIP